MTVCYCCLQHRLSSVKLLQQKMLAEIPMECVLLDDSTKFITLASHASLCPHYLVSVALYVVKI